MKYTRFIFLILITGLLGSTVFASDWCKDYNYGNSKRESARELRESTIPYTGEVKVDGRQNGGIRIVGEDRADVYVQACVRAWADSKAEAENLVQTTRIETGDVIKAVNDSEKYNSWIHWSLQNNLNIQKHAAISFFSGGISI